MKLEVFSQRLEASHAATRAAMDQRFAALAGKMEAFGSGKVAALKAAVAHHSQQIFEKERPTPLTNEEQEAKMMSLRAALGPLPSRANTYCTDDCLRRYLRARNWNMQQAEKMLQDTLRWRHEYRPEEIRWEDIADEGATGKVYRADFLDKKGRSVIVMSAGQQNTKGHAGQVRHLVYCLENAILNLEPQNATPLAERQGEARLEGPAGNHHNQQQQQQRDGAGKQEQMVWFIDFRGWTLRKAPPMRTARTVLNILQNHYPERLGAAVAFDPPNVFEAFWKVIRPFVDPVTFNKILFANPSKPESTSRMEEIFDLDKLEKAFGGRSTWTYSQEVYSEMMRRDDERMKQKWNLTDADRRHKQADKDPLAKQQMEQVLPQDQVSTQEQEQERDDGFGGAELADETSAGGMDVNGFCNSDSSSNGSSGSGASAAESPWLPADLLVAPSSPPKAAAAVLKSFNKLSVGFSSMKKPAWMGQ